MCGQNIGPTKHRAWIDEAGRICTHSIRLDGSRNHTWQTLDVITEADGQSYVTYHVQVKDPTHTKLICQMKRVFKKRNAAAS